MPVITYIAYGLYALCILIFLVIAFLAVYHVHRFGSEWDRTRGITAAFVIVSIVIISFSLIFMVRIPWEQLA